jgi:sarcosine oxidase subunit alpha
VVIAELDSVAGGSLLSERDDEWSPRVVAELDILTQTTVQAIYDGNLALLQQKRADGERLIALRAKTIIHATGAHERPLVFVNNDRPGVMLASAVRTYLNRFAVAPAKRAAVVTNNDSAYATAFDLAAAGVAVTLADHRAEIDPALVSKAMQLGVAVFPRTGAADVIGSKGVSAVRLAGGHAATIECDILAISGGWSPAVHLTSHGGIKPVYDPAIAAFVPGALAPSHFVAGGFGLRAAIDSGERAGLAAAGGQRKAKPVARPEGTDAPYRIAPSWLPFAPSKGKAFVDFQSDVTVKDIETAQQEGYLSVEHLKRYTTLGMGTDQGKTSNINALAIMAQLRGLPLEEAGTTTFRPPYAPLTLGALAGRNIGSHFRPTRRSPLHDWHAANGAAFIEAGLWKRAWYYAWAGNSPETAYIKEMELVRRGVGIADVSTLGKIDVSGKDAAQFLDRVYVNGFSKLPVGKARYGVMLNDDGVVLDDGTCVRLSDERYYMTTTTAQAGEVMSWLEFLLDTQWRDLDVAVTSLTDEFAAMSVAGPISRDALQLAFPMSDLSNESLPHMGCLDILHEGQSVRLIRMSFSGELAYEVHVSADYGQAIWEHILAAAAPLGIQPYGLEALASLRIEKGHVAGLELDHRNTLDDLGLGRMASKTKAYVGRELRMRENLQAPERWSLVGLQLLEPEKKLRGGAILFAANDEIKGHGRGYITSVTWSTELNCFIALGLYQGGLSHKGEEIVCAFPLKNETARARIVSPHFIDPENARLHA